jgi:hypothetical protein
MFILKIEEFGCISMASVDGKTMDTRPGGSFVDEMTTGATDDSHHIEPIPSWVSDVTLEAGRRESSSQNGRDNIVLP